MNTKMLLPALLLSAAVITPVSANWFSNPSLGINRNVGSAPNPTPAQVRQGKQPPFVLKDQDGRMVAEGAKQAAPAARQAPQSGPQSVATAAPRR